ncbi:MAG TPA: response regulator transcription factor [Acidimicrobiales bacterium]|nr:response regulator transcription factor [Acidimicrobiales bacterium]
MGDAIVVIEDDHHISDLVAMYLRRDGFRVLQADDGRTGLSRVEAEQPKLVVVDIGLPGELSGFDVCRLLRKHSDTPVVMLTARDDEVDRILGLELGADDYITKPFSPRELVARVHAILRRTAGPGAREAPMLIEVGSVVIDVGRREVRRQVGDGSDGDSEATADVTVPLTAREFDLLVYLATNMGLALSRRQLLNGVWGDGWYGDERTVDVHIRQLRKKIGSDLPLATVWSVGYRLG